MGRGAGLIGPQIAVAVGLWIVGALGGFVSTLIALHSFWPFVGPIPFLAVVFAITLSLFVVIAVVRRARCRVPALTTGLAVGAWGVASIFGGFVSF